MVGVILAGGMGTRLLPATKYINKCILPVGSKPMIYYPLMTVISSGIKRVVIITGNHLGGQVIEIIKSMKLPPIEMHFTTQKQPMGMPDAIRYADRYVNNEPIMVVAGDNIFGGNYKKFVTRFKKGEVSFLRRVQNPKLAGVPIYDGSGALTEIVEKPTLYTGKTAVCGPHFFDQSVFEIIKSLKPSARGELELVDVHNHYLRNDMLELVKTNDYWSDTGTFASLAKTSYEIINKQIAFPYDYL